MTLPTYKQLKKKKSCLFRKEVHCTSSLLINPFPRQVANRYYCSHQGENKGTITCLQSSITKIHESGTSFSETNTLSKGNISKEHQFLFSCRNHIQERNKAISLKKKNKRLFLNSSCTHIPIFSHKNKNTSFN